MIFSKEKIKDGERMMFSFLMSMAKKLNLSPKEFAEACVDKNINLYIAEFSAEYANAVTQKKIEFIKNKEESKNQ